MTKDQEKEIIKHLACMISIASIGCEPDWHERRLIEDAEKFLAKYDSMTNSGYKPSPENKPISGGYQPKVTPSHDIVFPPPPVRKKERLENDQ